MKDDVLSQMGLRDYAVAEKAPIPPGRKSVLRLRVEAMKPGTWLDTEKEPSRKVTRQLCDLCRRAEAAVGKKYEVKGDQRRKTTWVHCVSEETDDEQ